MRAVFLPFAFLLLTAAKQPWVEPTVPCSAGDDCTVKWAKAIHWALEHNSAIAEQTDVSFSTVPGVASITDEVRLNKIPTGVDTYEIRMLYICSNIFSCKMKTINADFVTVVGGSVSK